jgi:hypothetical protein
MAEKLLCTGDSCPLRVECAHWEGNNNCPEDCIGIAYFIRPPWSDGWCVEYQKFKGWGKENGGAGS